MVVGRLGEDGGGDCGSRQHQNGCKTETQGHHVTSGPPHPRVIILLQQKDERHERLSLSDHTGERPRPFVNCQDPNRKHSQEHSYTHTASFFCVHGRQSITGGKLKKFGVTSFSI